ncbi:MULTISPECIES: bifunctional UDP-N-acetylglucosamine diphosphorylase/glucosamine-1-phosphate N-acetyltransferase GlmU [unclassified Micromonospora]|uniref:bifunctional UDP-N-acetylglucosamine diphosphorylase/glucosamine-1-phosphate N-acetyltransferase GlmU n=1 Tax=unclassified Micromonospora TaxID=2617518 RepID=UPI0003EEA4A4|nr:MULTISPECIES: bifunctional UDP-N-acetylglucosamine diphosphorylase/glucosamine-1-phosphate N-acetyltransferase GlmU [unclassified Micromonospora]EWM66072.1 UDP-N-acetylglucosamine diphosphorylase/glucosamine-1-phosphate N-acetyltransferase [Micromonospora sp. M42]MCK1808526.1 bifunctional UDP-N-acetylglucosamine diphosphorylase/glucosamine-1-phosphate N-acetyltransferase GlmU [Micromonospora sp. R42106]MCK1833033.1 bifunctional UDP-N-acetylglucosamine diphosphorylase/glucosamine-1-phosphate N
MTARLSPSRRESHVVSQPHLRTVVVLAAGEGKRMKSSLPKVLHPLLGRTLLGHVLAAAGPLRADRTVVVVGHGADQVRAHLTDVAPAATPVLQERQLGTGHAVRIALDAVPDATGTVVVINGDVPLLRPETVRALVEAHEEAAAAATVLAAEVPDPTGLGRIVRDVQGHLEQIVEERDASPQQRALREINAGIYAFDAARLREALGKLSTDNDQGEEYLTDVFALLRDAGEPVAVHCAADYVETLGCNDRVELSALRRLLRDRVNEGWMRTGVSILDPHTTWIDVTVTVERDAVIDQNTQLQGATVVGAGALVGPDTTLVDTVVGAGASVVRSHALGAEVGPEASVGPYAYLRPESRLGRKAKVGTFVETKKTSIGEGSKVPHLSYVGDATIGDHSNIGAATVFVNYDGVRKHHTTIGSHARTGADNMFVAPVRVGDGAYTAAGSVITGDVPPGAMAVARGQQRNVEGWVLRKRAGTEAAEAARRAGEDAPESGAAAREGD